MGLPKFWVNTSSRNLVVEDTDFAYKGLGPAVTIQRTYNSNNTASSMFGRGWTFNFESSVAADPSLHITQPHLLRSDGDIWRFTDTYMNPTAGTGSVTPLHPAGIFDTLTWTYDGIKFSWIYKPVKGHMSYLYELSPVNKNKWFLSAISDMSGNTLKVNHSPDGVISDVTDAAGRKTNFIYNTDRLCTQITFPDGAISKFSYDTVGNLIKATDRIGNVLTYTYDSSGYMTSMSLLDRTITFAYSYNGTWRKEIANITDPTGAVTSYTPGDYGIEVQDSLGHVSIYGDDGAGHTTMTSNPSGETTSSTFTDGLLTTSNTGSGTYQREYNNKGEITKLTTPMNYTDTFSYDAHGDLIGITNGAGITSSFTRDSNRNIIRFTKPSTSTTYFS
jgi:YD repeat-containing protein